MLCCSESFHTVVHLGPCLTVFIFERGHGLSNVDGSFGLSAKALHFCLEERVLFLIESLVDQVGIGFSMIEHELLVTCGGR
jgi:hypothetical protein